MDLLEAFKLFGNISGLALLSGVLYKLHIRALDTHQSENAEQRKLFAEQMNAERDMCQRHHDEQQQVNQAILQTLTNLESKP